MATMQAVVLQSAFLGHSAAGGALREVAPRRAARASMKGRVVRAEERKYTGFVESDSAGQQNIYSVEPDVYVSDSGFSTGAKGNGGSGGTLLISGFLAVAAVAGAATVLLSVNRVNPTADTTPSYSGPPLSYYVLKFKNPTAVAPAIEAPELATPRPPAPTASEEAQAPSFLEIEEVVLEIEAAAPAAESTEEVGEVSAVAEPESVSAVAEPESVEEAVAAAE